MIAKKESMLVMNVVSGNSQTYIESNEFLGFYLSFFRQEILLEESTYYTFTNAVREKV